MYAKTQPNSSTASTREGGHVLEMQRRRLLLAHSEVLAEHGLQDASVDRICKRAGVSRRTFYDLFLDREGCFVAALELARERIAAEIGPAYMRSGRTQKAHGTQRADSTQRAHGWRMRVRAGLTALLELFDSEPALARMCVVETLKGGPQVLAWRRVALERLVEAIDEGRGENKSSPPPLTAEGAVGGVLSVIHTRLLERGSAPLLALVNPLMSMIVRPYLGPGVAARELDLPLPAVSPTGNGHAPTRVQDPFKDLPIRITFRTARVLAVVGAQPGASNRAVGDAAGIADQGQISKLLRRLERSGLLSNSGEGHSQGQPNAWALTGRGEAIQRTLDPPQA
jgi:AcrR family transcriptional regulator